MIRGARTFTLAFLVLTLAVSSVALAQSVSSSVQVDLGGVVSSDVMGPTSVSDAGSFLEPAGVASIDLGRNGYGRAAQNLNGVGAVSAEGVFANGGVSNSIVSNTLWTDSATNTTGGPITYEFSYLIAPPKLRLGDYASVSDATPGAPNATFHLVIRSNGSVVFESQASIVGGTIGHTLSESGTSLNPVFATTGSSNILGYDFDSATGVINLGVFNPGESVTVEYEMTTSVVSNGLETGGRAAVGDPFDLSGTPGFTGTFLANGAVAVEDGTIGQVKARY